MGYPARLLGEDERIELTLRSHGKTLLRPVLVLLVVSGIVSFVAAIVSEGSAQSWLRIALVAVAAFIVARWSLWPWLVWLTAHYVITNRRLIIREGVIVRNGRDMPLSRVNDVSFSQDSLLERVLSCGTLMVESAGERGQLTLVDVPRVEQIQRELYRLVEEDAERRHDSDDETNSS